MEHQRFLYSTVGEGGQREAPSQFAWTRRWLGLGSVSEKAVEKQEEGIDEDGSVIDVIQKILDAGNSNEVESGADRDDRLRCESYLHNLLRKSPMVRFMIKHLILVGCSPMDEDGNVGKIMIRKCPPTMAGGFASAAKPKQSGLLLCQNTIQSQKHMEATISHEMIHWFDHCRFKVDWQDWRHVACSEIRAANLSGDCRFWHEVFDRRQFGFRKQHQNCVRRRAVDSMVMSEDGPKVRETAEKVVDEVWASCFNDTRPFDEVY